MVRWCHCHDCFVPYLSQMPHRPRKHNFVEPSPMKCNVGDTGMWGSEWLVAFRVWNIVLPIVFHSQASYIQEPHLIGSPPLSHTGSMFVQVFETVNYLTFHLPWGLEIFTESRFMYDICCLNFQNYRERPKDLCSGDMTFCFSLHQTNKSNGMFSQIPLDRLDCLF